MAGADAARFRTALYGFNRYDVVEFIESLTGEHEKELRSLQQENSKLNEQLSNVQAENAALSSQIEYLLAKQPEEAAEPIPEPEETLPAPEAEEPTAEDAAVPSSTELELAAYRRAEAFERSAAERADRLYTEMNTVCTDLTGRLTASDDEISVLYTDLSAMLQRLQEALADVKQVFDDAPGQIKALSESEQS
jgi:methyl-accepting chemotaxis protein